MVVSDSRESDFRSLAAIEPGAGGGRTGTDRIGASQKRPIRRSGAASNPVSLGGSLAGGAAARIGAAVCGAEKHQGSGPRDSQDGRRSETTAVPCFEQPADTHGGG